MIDNPFGIPADVWASLRPVDEPEVGGPHGAAAAVACQAPCCTRSFPQTYSSGNFDVPYDPERIQRHRDRRAALGLEAWY